MDIVELFESPLPSLSIDADKIAVETTGNYEGSFIIRNTGGGELKGRILSNSSVIKFTPDSFNSKKTTVFYTLDISIYKPGDIIKTSAVIMSNGGEKIIPVVIKALPFCIETKENIKITSLKDFYRYAKKYPLSARQLFMAQDFNFWLTGILYPHMDSYEKFSRDPNKERALDNFFVLNKLKKQAYVMPVEKNVTVTVNPYMDTVVEGNLIFQRTTWGYLDASIIKEGNAKWLSLNKDKLTSADFDENNSASVGYNIEPRLIIDKTASERVIADKASPVTVYVKKLPPVTAVLSKETFLPNENGHIAVTNNTGKDLLIEVATTENYLKFEGSRYYISSYAEIPFDVKVTSLQSAQNMFKRRPSINVSLFVTAASYTYRKKLDILVGL